jgi:5'-nucleotidase
VPDLFVSGPNVGTNLGGFLFTLSGTIGSTYAAVGRGIPGIAFSGGSLYGQRGYKEINATTKSGAADPATIYAQKSVALVDQIAKTQRRGKPLFPLGYGLNVNYASVTSLTNTSCIDPKFYLTRLTGGAFTDKAVFNQTSGVFGYENLLGTGYNQCINGNCKLPGETTVVNEGCNGAVSVFTVDYDAPSGRATGQLQSALKPLVKEYKQKGGYKRELKPEEVEKRHE